MQVIPGQVRGRARGVAAALVGAGAAWGCCAPGALGDDGGGWTRAVHYVNAAGEVRTSTLSWTDGSGLTASAPAVVVGVGAGNAEGIVFGPGGELYVSGGAGGGRVRAVRVDGGVGTVVGNVQAGVWNGGSATAPSIGRIALTPDGRGVWGAGALLGGVGAGTVDRVATRPDLATGTASALFGDDTLLRSLAFVGERAYYTTGDGTGHFGTLDPAMMATTRLIGGAGGGEAARALVFDGYTGHLLMMGGGKITQIRVDLLAGGYATVVSQADLGALGVDIVAGGADGRGRLVGMGADGRAVVLDYRASRLVGWAGNAAATVMVDAAGGVTEMAPLSGPGALRDVACVWDNGDADGRSAQQSWRRAAWGGGGGGSGADGGRAADDLWVCPEELTRVDAFKATVRTNALIPKAVLEVYEDCDGAPGRLIAATGSAWATDLAAPPPEGAFRTVELAFLPDGLWLEGGRKGRAYWVSVVGLRGEGTTEEYLWMTSGSGAAGVKGRPGAARLGDDGPWKSAEELGCGCTDFSFSAMGETCKVLLDNGAADAALPAGVPSMLSWSGWETRSGDDFVVPGCNDARVCFLDATVYTNCVPVRGVFEVYAGGCFGPEGPALFATPFEDAMDLGYAVMDGAEVLRAYRVRASGVDWTLPGGRMYWLVAAGRGTGSMRQRTQLAVAAAECGKACRVRWGEGMTKGPLTGAGGGMGDWIGASMLLGSGERDLSIRVGVKMGKMKPVAATPALPVCRVDVNGDGLSTVDDLLLYLSRWFEPCP